MGGCREGSEYQGRMTTRPAECAAAAPRPGPIRSSGRNTFLVPRNPLEAVFALDETRFPYRELNERRLNGRPMGVRRAEPEAHPKPRATYVRAKQLRPLRLLPRRPCHSILPPDRVPAADGQGVCLLQRHDSAGGLRPLRFKALDRGRRGDHRSCGSAGVCEAYVRSLALV